MLAAIATVMMAVTRSTSRPLPASSTAHTTSAPGRNTATCSSRKRPGQRNSYDGKRCS